MTRYIGIRHRVKKTADGEAHPTQVVILTDVRTKTLNLDDEQAELDFVLGILPTKFRVAKKGEDLSQFSSHHIKKRKKRGSVTETETIVPNSFEGFSGGDIIAMILGGSGDNFAFALSRRAKELGGQVLRISPFILKDKRSREKEYDAITLAQLVRDKPKLFYPVADRDRALIIVRESLVARTDAMKARIACEQRLRQHFIGSIFCSPDGFFPEGGIEKAFDEKKANDTILSVLVGEEKTRNKDLKGALEDLDIYRRLFDPIKGCGPAIAAPIISGIIDIRRFKTDAQLKAFCGVHVLPDGKFVRRRKGQLANWNPGPRQALWLLGDQFNRRPDSVWGKKLREYKVKLREKHPKPIIGENGKKRYTDGHIHKMATWRTLTKFVEWLHREWWRLERESEKGSVPLQKAA